MTAYFLEIQGFYTHPTLPTLPNIPIRITSLDEAVEFGGHTWSPISKIDIDSITGFLVQEYGDRPHAAVRLNIQSDTVRNVFRSFLGFPPVELIEAER